MSSVVASLEDVVADVVEPGMTVFIDSTAMAAARALVRVFAGTSPKLTVIVPRGGMIAPELVAGGVIRKLIAGGLLNGQLGRIPPPVVQDARYGGAVEIELLSLQATALRLMAGAIGWPFVPSRSIGGTDLERCQADAVARVEDPFEGRSAVVLQPLVSDVAIGHAAVADPHGRAVFPDSSDHGGWGLRSCCLGVVVAAETVTEVLPSTAAGERWVAPSRVLAVCSSPRAAHPYGFTSPAPELAASYDDDKLAIASYAEALTTRASIDEDKVRDASASGASASHVDHVRSRRRQSDDNDGRAARQSADISFAESVYLAGTELTRLVIARDLRCVLEGSGKAKLISHYAVAALNEHGCVLDRVGGVGGLNGEHIGANPIEAYGYLLGGLGARSVGVLSALQIDRFGNINNTELREGPTMLVGSGGANDAGSHCDEILVVTSGHVGALVRSVDFVTVPGSRVRLVVAGRCVFERNTADEPFRLARLLGAMTPAAEMLIASAASSGWHVDQEPELIPLPEGSGRRHLDSVLKG
jgi:acyl CoA:acetate/3-ketoacid CoA transferase alpha subunit